ncbi:hypothetical protein A2U01_0116250 [Trifolium medium]|uniref:Uncharacterized protein n=1 Tax=Trifolium medium TaxID=97028 RepID=A0A392W5G9_9FABA|nr:hypothetical protein [Trifolium medium]
MLRHLDCENSVTNAMPDVETS